MPIPAVRHNEHMNKKHSLCSMNVGERGTVAGISGQTKEKRRLREIGLTDSTCVECVLKRGEISAYLIKGTVIALRNSDAFRVEITQMAGGERTQCRRR